MKKSIRILLHLILWIVLLMFTLGMAFMGQNVNENPEEFSYYFDLAIGFFFLPCLTTVYGYTRYLFPKYLQHSKWWKGTFVAFLISVGAVLVGLFYLINISFVENSLADACIQDGMIFIFFIATFMGCISLIIKGFLTWFEELKLKEALRQKNYEMEMSLIKSQLDPHFLFNTINNIDVLILKNAEKASNYLNKLSDIMRFMLYETKTDEIPLTKEVEYIEKYIELQKIRTMNNEYVKYEVSGNLENKKIAPMVFIPFIENAFKHTFNKKLKEAIHVKIEAAEKYIRLICKNKFDPHRKSKNGSNGLGNELIEKRLNLIYPEKYILKIDKENGEYSVNLMVNI